jgi:CO dehydrogenase/acetyl-CoA synthase beta subunit
MTPSGIEPASCSGEDTGWSKCVWVPNNYSTEKPRKIRTIPTQLDDLKMAITEYIRNTDRAILNTDRAILNTVFENTVRRVNKCLETGGGQFERYL